MCTTNELIEKIKEVKELERLIKEAEKEVEVLKNEIKEEMELQNTEVMEVGVYTIRWTSVLSNRFDTTSLKQVMPEVYKMYLKQTPSRRFTISG